MSAFAVTVCIMKKENYIGMSWKRLLIPMAVIAVICVVLLLTQTWYGERLTAFISGNDTYGYGWHRHVAGIVFGEAGMSGCSGLEIAGYPGAEILSRFGSSRLLLYLFHYGWPVTLILILMYCILYLLPDL